MGALSFVIGAFLSILGSIASNLGVNIQKYSFVQNAQLPKHLQKKYIQQKLWWIGFGLVLLGSIGDFSALALVAQSIVAPIGSMTLVTNIFFAHYWLKETLRKKDLIGTGMIVLGCILAVSFGDKSDQTYTMDQIRQFFAGGLFISYAVLSFIFVVGLLYFIKRITPIRTALTEAGRKYEKAVQDNDAEQAAFMDAQVVAYEQAYRKYEKLHPFSLCAVSGVFGGQSIMFGKMVAVLIAASAQGQNQFTNPLTYLFIIFMGAMVASQLHYLAQALNTFDALYCVPVFQCFFIGFSTMGGACFFQEFSTFSAVQGVFFPLGLIITLGGVVVLSSRQMHVKRNITHAEDEVDIELPQEDFIYDANDSIESNNDEPDNPQDEEKLKLNSKVDLGSSRLTKFMQGLSDETKLKIQMAEANENNLIPNTHSSSPKTIKRVPTHVKKRQSSLVLNHSPFPSDADAESDTSSIPSTPKHNLTRAHTRTETFAMVSAVDPEDSDDLNINPFAGLGGLNLFHSNRTPISESVTSPTASSIEMVASNPFLSISGSAVPATNASSVPSPSNSSSIEVLSQNQGSIQSFGSGSGSNQNVPTNSQAPGTPSSSSAAHTPGINPVNLNNVNINPIVPIISIRRTVPNTANNLTSNNTPNNPNNNATSANIPPATASNVGPAPASAPTTVFNIRNPSSTYNNADEIALARTTLARIRSLSSAKLYNTNVNSVLNNINHSESQKAQNAANTPSNHSNNSTGQDPLMIDILSKSSLNAIDESSDNKSNTIGSKTSTPVALPVAMPSTPPTPALSGSTPSSLQLIPPNTPRSTNTNNLNSLNSSAPSAVPAPAPSGFTSTIGQYIPSTALLAALQRIKKFSSVGHVVNGLVAGVPILTPLTQALSQAGDGVDDDSGIFGNNWLVELANHPQLYMEEVEAVLKAQRQLELAVARHTNKANSNNNPNTNTNTSTTTSNNFGSNVNVTENTVNSNNNNNESSNISEASKSSNDGSSVSINMANQEENQNDNENEHVPLTLAESSSDHNTNNNNSNSTSLGDKASSVLREIGSTVTNLGSTFVAALTPNSNTGILSGSVNTASDDSKFLLAHERERGDYQPVEANDVTPTGPQHSGSKQTQPENASASSEWDFT